MGVSWKPVAVHSQTRAELETGNPAGTPGGEFSDLPKFQSVHILHPPTLQKEAVSLFGHLPQAFNVGF